jgi:hypothetical protein
MTHPQPVVPGPVSDFLAEVALAPRQAWKALTLWPLVQREDVPERGGPPFVTLGEALAGGSLHVDEVSEGGSVPQVRVTNTGADAVLFLFGEEIKGALQNRVANASFLVPPKSHVVLDVSCVEAGRWSRGRGERFRGTREVLSSALRKKMARKVARARAAAGGAGRFHADQAEVWDEIEQRISFSGAPSSTRAYADYRESRSSDLDEIGRAFRPVERQVGFVTAIGDGVAGIEAIGSPRAFEQSFRALLRAYAIDAVDASLVNELGAPAERNGSHFDAPESFLEALARAPFASGPSLGAGDDLRFEGPAVSGCALAHEGLVHLMAFPAQG